MLLTTCPTCSAQFKVQPEQLNVRQGRVMCGRCRNVFNAFQSLTRVAEGEISTHGSTPDAMHESEDAAAVLTGGIFLREEPMPLSREFAQSDFAARQQTPESCTSLLDASDDLMSASLIEPDGFLEDSSSSTNAEPPATQIPVVAGEAQIEAPANPLLAATPVRRPAGTKGRARLWSAGALMMLLVLFAQVAFAFRATIAQTYPQLRSAYTGVCEWVGCSLSWGRDDTAIRIEASDLVEAAGKAGNIQLTATLVNRSTARQDFPAVELKLTDNANQVILSRVLLPHEYLGRMPGKDENLAPNVELYVNLNIELANRVQASGYGVRAFYQ